MAVATKDKLVTLEEVKALKDNIAKPSIELQITTGQWSGSSGNYTYSVNATNVTSTTKIDWSMDSSINYLTNDLTVTPGSGTIVLSTPSLPTGTVNVTLFFPGVQGEVVVQVLSDVYSKSQTDAKIQQSTAKDQWITSTTSFLDCTHPTGISDNFGNALDGLHADISSYTNNQISTKGLSSGGPYFGTIFLKVSNSYYGGLMFGYYGSVVLAFKYSNGTYSIRFL